VIGWLLDTLRDLAARGRSENGIFDGHRIFQRGSRNPDRELLELLGVVGFALRALEEPG
jgi:hypothetical protein